MIWNWKHFETNTTDRWEYIAENDTIYIIEETNYKNIIPTVRYMPYVKHTKEIHNVVPGVYPMTLHDGMQECVMHYYRNIVEHKW